MLTYIIRRVLYSIPVLFASTFLSFLFVSYAGNPVGNIRQNPHVSASQIKHFIIQQHLNVSVPIRYFYWLDDAFTHKLGSSLLTSTPIWPDMSVALENTAQVVLLAWIISFLLGCAVGIYSAIRQYSFFDYSFTTFSFLGFAMPTFWLALLLQVLFVDEYNKWGVRIFYTSTLNTPGSGAWSLDRLQHIALPVITLATISFAVYSRYMRASMLDVINSDYVRTARAKGVPEWRVILRHVTRNALIPLVTIAALDLGSILGGAIVTETVFTLQGMGAYFVSRLGATDIYPVMAYLLITAIFIIVANLVADILYGFLDPRIRYD